MKNECFTQLEASSMKVRSIVRVPLSLVNGEVVPSEIISFHGFKDSREHFAVRLGPVNAVPMVRIHSECITGDVLGSARCDCGPQLSESLCLIHLNGGFVLYLRQEGRGIGLYGKLEAYLLQDEGHDTYTANRMLGFKDDERCYDVAAEMLKALQVQKILLLSNNPDKRSQLIGAGIDVLDQVPTGVFLNSHNRRYLQAKVDRTSHLIALSPAKEVQ